MKFLISIFTATLLTLSFTSFASESSGSLLDAKKIEKGIEKADQMQSTLAMILITHDVLKGNITKITFTNDELRNLMEGRDTRSELKTRITNYLKGAISRYQHDPVLPEQEISVAGQEFYENLWEVYLQNWFVHVDLEKWNSFVGADLSDKSAFPWMDMMGDFSYLLRNFFAPFNPFSFFMFGMGGAGLFIGG